MGKLLMGSSNTKTKATSDPWGPQGDALKRAFNEAGSIYDSKKGTPFYEGDLYANMDPLTGQGIDAATGFATGDGTVTARNLASASSGLFGAGGQGMEAYGRLADIARSDPTAMNIRNAGAYADNPYMDGMIDAASRDVTRNLTEGALPSIDRAATATGNINSTRAGIASGIATRGAQDAIFDISANMRGDAYQRGLGLSEGARTANMSGLGAAGAGLGSMFGVGLNGAQAGVDMAYRNADALVRGGQMRQQDEQGALDADFKRWQGNDTRTIDLLNRYYGIIGANNWGGTQESVTKGPKPGLLQIGAGLAATYAGAGGKL